MTGKEAVAALPDSVMVGPFQYAIKPVSVHVSMEDNRFGCFYSASFIIEIQEDIPSVAKAVDTLLHEILHAIWWVYGLEDVDKEERSVGTMATALTALHRDNPWLSGWIAKALA